jgi:DNA-binding SARP family transcriptional activator/tetratricopeptide (TPR) repeat protein
MSIKFTLLGVPRFERNNQPIELKSTKAIALLGYLAVTGNPHSRDHLIDLLWPDSLPDAARKNLRNTLWAIRKSFGDDLLQGDADRMTLSDGVWVDARVFETAAQNGDAPAEPLSLYQAPLLNGLTPVDAPDFELWLATERERFGQLYLRLLETQAAVYQAAGDWPAVVATAHRALAADNLQEPMYCILMEAHGRLGERAEALRHYDTLRTTLAQELGVTPLAETEALRTSILNGEFDLGETSATRPAPAPATPRPRQIKASLPFTGRQTELNVLDEEFQHAGQGRLRVVLITGELGLGKSRLWQVWSQTLPESVTVLETRCLDTTQSLPFAPLTGLFSQSVCIEQIVRPDSPVPMVWLSELTRLLPAINHHLPGIPTPPALPPEGEHRRLFEAFVQLLRTIDSRPLVLFIDDIHWIDRATLDWLVYLADRMSAEPLLLVAAYRPADASALLSQVTAGWNREGVAQRLPLAHLTAEETAALISDLDGDPARVPELRAKSAGNPYFLIELSRAEPGSTPPGLAELIRSRLGRLPETARQVLQAAAVLDADFDFVALRRTGGRGEEETLNALDALLDAAVLQERPTGYQFTHPLVAALVRDDLSLARRSFLHRRAAEALESIYANRISTVAGQLAHHYAQAGRPEQSAAYAQLAAEHALSLAALTEAVSFYRQAITLAATPARRLGLGRALILQGDFEQGRAELEAAGCAFEQADDPVEQARAYLELAMSYMASGQGSAVMVWAKAALESVGTRLHPEIHARAHHLLAAGGMLTHRPLAEAESHLQETIRLATDNNLPELAGSARFELGNLLAQQGDLTGAIAAFESALNFARVADSLFQRVLAHNNLGYHYMLAGQLLKARENVEQGLSLSDQNALFLPRLYLYSTRGEIALAEGDFDGADTWFAQALEEAERHDNQAQAAGIVANQGLVARKRGNLDEALLLLEEAHHKLERLSSPHLQIKVDLWLTELYHRRGEHAAALDALYRAEGRPATSERAGLRDWAARLRQVLKG